MIGDQGFTGFGILCYGCSDSGVRGDEGLWVRNPERVYGLKAEPIIFRVLGGLGVKFSERTGRSNISIPDSLNAEVHGCKL